MSPPPRKPLIYVIYYSMHGHIEILAKEVVKGLERSGVDAKLWQVAGKLNEKNFKIKWFYKYIQDFFFFFAETLPVNVLEKMHAPPKNPDVPIITADQLPNADGYLFGVPTRFGTMPGE